MTLPDMHPYAGRATTLTRAMTNDTEEAMMGSRLAQAQDRIQELEEENERLRDACASLYSAAQQALRAQEPVDPRTWRSLSKSISSAREALNGAEGSTDE